MKKNSCSRQRQNQNGQKNYSEYDEYTNDTANTAELNRYLIVDVDILEKPLNEIMVFKICKT